MNIWLIYPYGSIPGEGKRPDRPAMIADALIAKGHTVTWWASCFDHVSKTFRSDDWKDIEVSPNFTIRLVPALEYKKNISYKRILSEKKYSKEIYSYSKEVSAPDIVILSEPALFRGKPIMKLVDDKNCLLLLDMLDQWPELFDIVLPHRLKFLGKILFRRLYNRRRDYFRKADAVFTVSRSYMDLVESIVPTLSAKYKSVVYFGTNVSKQRSEMSQLYNLPAPLNKMSKGKHEVWAIYASTLGSNYDLKTLLDAAKLLETREINIKLLIAGSGPLQDYVVSYIKKNKLKKVIYIGNPSSESLAAVYSMCDIGLSMYVKGSTVTMPIKAFHYFAAGLAVVNSLDGDLASLLVEHNAGMHFEAEDSESLVNALSVLASERDLRETMAKNSFALASDFDEKVQYKQVSDLVELVAQRDMRSDTGG